MNGQASGSLWDEEPPFVDPATIPGPEESDGDLLQQEQQGQEQAPESPAADGPAVEPPPAAPLPEPVPAEQLLAGEVQELCGAIFTTRQGTFQVYDRLVERFGKGTLKPACSREVGGCGHVTSYAVIRDLMGQKRRHYWAFMCQGAFYKLDGWIYFPMRVCHKCSAAKDGYWCGKVTPERHDVELGRIHTAPLTEEEKEEARIVFKRAFAKGQQAKLEQSALAARAKDKGRYRMGGSKEAAAGDD